MGTSPLCLSPNRTLEHITNMSTIALSQGQFSWWYNSVIIHIKAIAKSLATCDTEVFADLPNLQVFFDIFIQFFNICNAY